MSFPVIHQKDVQIIKRDIYVQLQSGYAKQQHTQNEKTQSTKVRVHIFFYKEAVMIYTQKSE